MDDVLNGLKNGVSGHRFHRSKNHSQASAETTPTEWCISTTAFWSHDTFITGGFSGFLPHPPKVSPSDRAGCLVVRLGGIHLKQPCRLGKRDNAHTVPLPVSLLNMRATKPIWQKLLKITFLLYELRSSNFGGIPAFNIPIFISAVRKRNHGLSSAGTAARSVCTNDIRCDCTWWQNDTHCSHNPHKHIKVRII